MSIREEMLKMVTDAHVLNMFEKLELSQNNIVEVAKSSVSMKDSYGNSLLSIGNDDEAQRFENYRFTNDTLNWSLWLALYNDSWVFRRAIDKPSQDCIRAGVTLHAHNNVDDVYRDLKKFRFDLIQLLQWGALFGGSVAVIMLDNLHDEDYQKPLDVTTLRKSKTMRMYVTDRWYGCAPDYSKTVTNMSDIDFGKPMYYDITFADGKTVKIHHSYILRYEHRTAPKLVKQGMLQGWGYAEGTHIVNELSRDDKLKSSIQSLIDKSLIEIIKMSGMRGVFMGADQENETQLRKRLEMVNWGRNYNSLTFLDKEDEYQMNQFSGLGGLSDLLEKNMWQIAAALEMQGVLFGDLKQGFSNDTEALQRYDETINCRNESYVRPVLTKLISILYKKYCIDERVEFEFDSLLKDNEKSDATEALSKVIGVCSSMLNDGVIDLAKYASIIQNYTTNDVFDVQFTDEEIEKLKDKSLDEMENINLGGEKM